jgi:hypothetical protein
LGVPREGGWNSEFRIPNSECATISATEIERMKDLIGRTLGHYRIVEQIGAGGIE